LIRASKRSFPWLARDAFQGRHHVHRDRQVGGVGKPCAIALASCGSSRTGRQFSDPSSQFSRDVVKTAEFHKWSVGIGVGIDSNKEMLK
jgi:hypothetical protein